VVFFQSDLLASNLSAGSLAGLITALDRRLPSANMFYALRLDGEFSYLKTRSVPRQEQPYRPLIEIVKTQPTFEWRNVHGTLLGFRCPAGAAALNVPGWHLHFITADRTGGGHVLDLRLVNQTAALEIIPTLSMTLPTNAAFLKLDLSGDSSEAVKRVEK
jgi:acetolactate decarboxylase